MGDTLWVRGSIGKLGNGRYCYPLTITDRYSRLILRVEALESAKADPAISVFDQAFREHGLPKVIRTDNGPRPVGLLVNGH